MTLVYLNARVSQSCEPVGIQRSQILRTDAKDVDGIVDNLVRIPWWRGERESAACATASVTNCWNLGCLSRPCEAPRTLPRVIHPSKYLALLYRALKRRASHA